MTCRVSHRFLVPFFLSCVLVGANPVALARGLHVRAPHIPVNVQVSHDAFLAHSEPSVAENPRHPRDLVAASKFFSDPSLYQFKIGYFVSFDGGKHWKDRGLLPGFGAYAEVSDVTLAFNRRGDVYACVLAVGKPGSGVFVLKSTNGGRTFGRPVTVFLDPTAKNFSDKPWLAVDTSNGPTHGNVYVAWDLDSSTADAGDHGEAQIHAEQSGPLNPKLGQEIAFSRSTDGGRTFSPAIRISGPTQNSVLGAVPAVGPDRTVTVMYAIYDKYGATAIDIVRSTDAGVTFGAPILVTPVVGIPYHLRVGTFRNFTLPDFAASPHTSALYIVWSDYGQGQADVLLSRSSDGGITWSPPQRINDDPAHNGADHFMPAVAVAPDGVVTVSWFDRRRDPTDRLIDTYLAQSTDGGVTFLPNRRVTTTAWDPAIDAPEPEHKPTDTFIGDYQGLCVDNTLAHPLWNATENGRSQEIYTAAVTSVQPQ